MIALDDGRSAPGSVASMAALGVKLTLIRHRPSWAESIARSALTRRSLYTARFRSGPFARAVNAHLSSEWVDALQCEYGYMAGYLLDLPTMAAGVILDEHNLEWELAGTGRVYDSRPSLTYRAYAAREGRLRRQEECAAAERADKVLTVSPQDRDRLTSLAPDADVAVVPNGVDTDAFAPSDRPESERGDDIVFVGKLDYGPNVDGLVWFVREVWPQVRAARPDATLRIVGRGAPPLVVGLGREPGVSLVGEVPDTRPHLEHASAAIVPLRRGGGTRLKILEALAMGRPVVSTTAGAAGLDLPPDAIVIADGARDFSRAVEALLGDVARRAALSRRGREEACLRFGWDRIVTDLEESHRALARASRQAAERAKPGRLL